MVMSAPFASRSFNWPKVTGTRFAITQEQWHWLIMGVDWQRLSAVPNAHWEV
jgi:transposase